jgi:peroxiredoxin
MRVLTFLLLATAAIAQSQPQTSTSPEVQSLIIKARSELTPRQAEQAIKDLKQALKLQSNCSVCEFYLSQAYEAIPNESEAFKANEKYLSMVNTPRDVALGHNQRGMLLSRKAEEENKSKLHEQAAAEFRQAIAQESSASYHLNVGIELLRLNQDADGLAEFKRIIDDPVASEATKHRAQLFIDEPRRARETMLPEFKMVTADGRTITDRDLRGKVVLLDFWATWCPPCRASIPEVRETAKKFSGDNFVLISVSIDSDEDKWRTFIKDKNMDWTQVFDDGHKLTEMFQAHSIPRYFVVDTEGVIHKMVIGNGNFQSAVVHDEIKKALKAAKSKG